MTNIISNFNFQSALNSVVSCKRQSWIWSNRLSRGFSYSKLQSRSTSTFILQSASCTAVTELNEPYFGLVVCPDSVLIVGASAAITFFSPFDFLWTWIFPHQYWPNPIIHNNCKEFLSTMLLLHQIWTNILTTRVLTAQSRIELWTIWNSTLLVTLAHLNDSVAQESYPGRILP